MKKLITALNLCVDKDNWREYCHRPFRNGKHLCATNGKMLVCIPNYYLKQSTLKHYEKIETDIDVQQYIVRAKVSETKPIRYTLSQLEALFNQAANEPIYGCKDCSGTGKVVYEYLSRTDDTYELEAKCPICNGTGIICNGIGIQGKKTQTAFRYATGLPLISITLTYTLMQILKQIGIDTVKITHNDQHSITITINFDIIIVVMDILVDENVHKHWDIIEPSLCEMLIE
jgi:hypothetical protein